MRKVVVAPEVFELVPEFFRGLVIVEDCTNPPYLETVADLLQKSAQIQSAVDLAADPRLAAWDAAHRRFGSNPNKFPPSIKSLLKRVKNNPQLPYVNTVVALFNYISMKYGLPCGGDDLAQVEGDLKLGLSDGTELFLALGSEKPETPAAGEVIYYDTASKTVMCRRWNWRNGSPTKIDLATRRLVINIDCLPPLGPETGRQARDELADLLVRYCGARLSVSELHAGVREIEIGI